MENDANGWSPKDLYMYATENGLHIISHPHCSFNAMPAGLAAEIVRRCIPKARPMNLRANLMPNAYPGIVLRSGRKDVTIIECEPAEAEEIAYRINAFEAPGVTDAPTKGGEA